MVNKNEMTNKPPSFSICIPNFNYGKYIGHTIKSVLEQTYQNFEIIVVDNASTDNSIEIVKSFNDSRVKLYKNNYNIGFAPNLQKTTSLAKNEFINLLSSDDQMKPNALETYASIIEENAESRKSLLLLSDYESFDDNDNITATINKSDSSFGRVKTLPPNKITAPKTYTKYTGTDVLKDGLSRLDTIGGFLTIAYSRELWLAIEGYNSIRTIGPDTHFILKLLTQNPTVIHTSQILFRYRDQLSDNRSAILNNVRLQIDQYLNVLEFGNENISKATGLRKDDLVTVFIKKYCLDKSLQSLSRGNYSLGFKIFTFALSTYPLKTFSNMKTYFVILLLALGPFSKIISSPLKLLYLFLRSKKNE
tara:strand:+ start:16652 stop:17740 length:1089 start_codon:yes stop_codon:yes gene_type:complete